MAEIKVRGAWAASSTVTEQHYRRDPEGRGAFAVAGAGGEFTHPQLVNLARKPLDTCPDLSDEGEVANDDPYDLDGVDEWVQGEGSDGDRGEDDLPEFQCESGSSTAMEEGSPSVPRVTVPSPAVIPATGVGKKRVLPMGVAAVPKSAKTSAGVG
ncbi:hypothetical protein B484DRAFT_437522, partial [Ochromonadaceae sp. CCMP2298]